MPLWTQNKPLAALTPEAFAIYILDGVYLSGRENATLICRTMTAQLAWCFTQRETFKSWSDFFATLPEPRAVVIDGQKGLLAAIQRHCPQALVQRCIVHIERLARIKLTRHPKTVTGRNYWAWYNRFLTCAPSGNGADGYALIGIGKNNTLGF